LTPRAERSVAEFEVLIDSELGRDGHGGIVALMLDEAVGWRPGTRHPGAIPAQLWNRSGTSNSATEPFGPGQSQAADHQHERAAPEAVTVEADFHSGHSRLNRARRFCEWQ